MKIKKIKKLFLLFCLLFAMNVVAQEIKICPLIPYPQHCDAVSDVFNLTERTAIIYDKNLGTIAHYLQKELLHHKGFGLPLSR